MRWPVDNWDKWYDAQPFGSKTDYGYHEGADINLKTGGDTDLGQSLFAIADGVVTSVHKHTNSGNFGFHVHIRHEGPWGTVWCHYAHCSEIKVVEGQTVKEGELVALVGKSGTVYSHCHWAIKLASTGIEGIAKNLDDLKKWTNPISFVLKWISPPVVVEPSGEFKFTQEQYDKVRLERDANWKLYQGERDQHQKDLDDISVALGTSGGLPSILARIKAHSDEKEVDRQMISALEDERDALIEEKAKILKRLDEFTQALEEKTREIASLTTQANIMRTVINQNNQKQSWIEKILKLLKG